MRNPFKRRRPTTLVRPLTGNTYYEPPPISYGRPTWNRKKSKDDWYYIYENCATGKASAPGSAVIALNTAGKAADGSPDLQRLLLQMKQPNDIPPELISLWNQGKTIRSMLANQPPDSPLITTIRFCLCVCVLAVYPLGGVVLFVLFFGVEMFFGRAGNPGNQLALANQRTY